MYMGISPRVFTRFAGLYIVSHVVRVMGRIRTYEKCILASKLLFKSIWESPGNAGLVGIKETDHTGQEEDG